MQQKQIVKWGTLDRPDGQVSDLAMTFKEAQRYLLTLVRPLISREPSRPFEAFISRSRRSIR